MTEINNNIPKYLINKIDQRSIEPESTHEGDLDIKAQQSKEVKELKDTGVLGRSQIREAKGFDVTRSIDETIALMEKYPEIAECGDELFDTLYEQFLSDGMSNSEAYEKASLAMEEFVEISKAQLAKNLD